MRTFTLSTTATINLAITGSQSTAVPLPSPPSSPSKWPSLSLHGDLAKSSWTICHSVGSQADDDDETDNYARSIIPPSRWDSSTYEKNCFLKREANERSGATRRKYEDDYFHPGQDSELERRDSLEENSTIGAASSFSLSAPGTALFQHWLHDYRNSSAFSRLPLIFDPWNDFPSSEIILRTYPDIGSDEGVFDLDLGRWKTDYDEQNQSTSASTFGTARSPEKSTERRTGQTKNRDNRSARDYYTLWYTAELPFPEPSQDQRQSEQSKEQLIIEANDSSSSDSSSSATGRAATASQQQARWRRGHLILYGVNYLPKVYFDGRLILPYSTHEKLHDNHDFIDTVHEEGNLRNNFGGMFLRRHYDLGIAPSDMKDGAREGPSNEAATPSFPLEILVLPPPHVGKPTLSHSSSSSSSKSASEFESQSNHFRKVNNNNITSTKNKSQSPSSTPNPTRRQQPQGQGGNHDLAKSGAIMQCTAGWDWVPSHVPDRNTGIWDRVEVEWVWGDVKLDDVYVRVLNVTAAARDDESQDENSYVEFEDKEEEERLPLGDDVAVSAWLDLSVTATYHGSRGRDNNTFPIWGSVEYVIKHHQKSGDKRKEHTTSPSSSSKQPNSHVLVNGTVHAIAIASSVSTLNLGQIHLPRAKLWWPHTHGSQPLYSVELTFRSLDGKSDDAVDGNNGSTTPALHESTTQSTFGIRTISSFTHPKTKSFALKVNGHPIFLQGGNWITTDLFLRYSNSPKRYLQELQLLRNVGFNSLRVWGGGIAETTYFYEAADLLGLLIYQEFWMTGDNNGRFAGDYDWPLNHEAYLHNVRDTVKRLRNHPSLAWYGGGNELFPIAAADSGNGPGGVSPPSDIEAGIKQFISDVDGTRPYVTSSVMEAGDDDSFFDPERSLGPKDGPYGILDEELFFDRNPGLTTPVLSDDEIHRGASPSNVKVKDAPGRNIGFQTEVGSVSHPELKSLQRFLSHEAMDSFPNCGETSERGGSVHEEWSYFNYLPFTESEDIGVVDHICSFLYPPLANATSENGVRSRMKSIDDYTWAAQLAQYFQYKTLFEGYAIKMWEYYSAIYLWKSSSPSPTFRGALYDWYLSTNGGYWGARSGLAGGSPVRLVLNLQDFRLHIVNSLSLSLSPQVGIDEDWGVKWSSYTLDGSLTGSGFVRLKPSTIHGNSVSRLDSPLPWLGNIKTSNRIMGLGIGDELPDVLIYKLEFSYNYGGSPPVMWCDTNKTTNTYFLTNPTINNYNFRQSRFSLFGAVRTLLPKVDLDVECRAIDYDNFECNLKNVESNHAAIMTTLTLSRGDLVEATWGDDRILPTVYSENYITLLPGETGRVGISAKNLDFSTTCDESKIVMLDGDRRNSSTRPTIVVSIDGWNVKAKQTQVKCAPTSIV